MMPGVYSSPTTTQTADSSSTRYNLGPLTTLFTPPPTCGECFVESWMKRPGACRAYYTGCHSGQSTCLPGKQTWELFAMYSPGLVCPAGWTTATVVSAETADRFTARDVMGRLEHGETAAFCCPAGFEFEYGSVNSYSATVGPRCISTVIEGSLAFWLCGADGRTTFAEVAVGTSTITSTIPWTSTRIETFEIGGPSRSGPTWNTTTIIIPLLLTTTETTSNGAATFVPAVQLVWQHSDLGLIKSSGPSTTTTSPTPGGSLSSGGEAPLPTSTIIGISVGAVLFALCMAIAIVWYLRGRWRKGGGKAPATADHNISNLTKPGDEPQSPFSGKAELDATHSTIWADGPGMGKHELPAVSVSPPLPGGPQGQRFELDTTPAALESAQSKQASGPSADQNTVLGSTLGPPRPVSAVSDHLSQRPHMVSPPSMLSGVGSNNGHTAEGWRASILEK